MIGKERGLTLMEVLIALVVMGIAVSLFLNMQKRSGGRLSANSNLLKAGQLIEKHVEAIRISVASDTTRNWPPRDTSYTEARITLVRRVSEARSFKGNLPLPNVRRVQLLARWNNPRDSLVITTYVAKRF